MDGLIYFSFIVVGAAFSYFSAFYMMATIRMMFKVVPAFKKHGVNYSPKIWGKALLIFVLCSVAILGPAVCLYLLSTYIIPYIIGAGIAVVWIIIRLKKRLRNLITAMDIYSDFFDINDKNFDKANEDLLLH